jgi:hypothetical protein
METTRKTRPNLKRSTCKHFNGRVNVECHAGVKYADVNDAAGVAPCIDWNAWEAEEREKRPTRSPLNQREYAGLGCSLREIPTDDEIAASKAESDERFKQISESLAKGIVPPGVFVCGRRR